MTTSCSMCAWCSRNSSRTASHAPSASPDSLATLEDNSWARTADQQKSFPRTINIHITPPFRYGYRTTVLQEYTCHISTAANLMRPNLPYISVHSLFFFASCCTPHTLCLSPPHAIVHCTIAQHSIEFDIFPALGSKPIENIRIRSIYRS